MTQFPISSLYAGACGLLVLLLSLRVVQLRRSQRVGMGDGANPDLARRIRVHANAVETIPLSLILLVLAEAAGAAGWCVHLAGATLVFARLIHAIGFSHSAGYSLGRFWGTLLTWLVMLALSLYLLGGPLLH